MADARFDPPLEHCPLCRCERLARFDHDSKGLSIDRCRDCGLWFMNPQYTESYLEHYYATYIKPDEREGKEAQEKARQKRAGLQALTRWRRGGRFLAVGCGGGLELEIARELGFTVEGYDVDPATTQEVARRLGVPVHAGAFSDLQLPDGGFDCIYLDQVLEHLKNPADYLRRLRRLLKPDGVVYIGVPNLASFSARLKTLQGRLGLKRGSRGRHYDTDHHLMHFRPRPLQRILEREFRFEVLAVLGDPRVGISPLRFRLARRHPLLCSRFVVIARPAGGAAGSRI